ncbi:hypothetical protein COT82_00915 [Candidatus Campbellbacteria bacterium CG10_big_fil_rev_8_21_14_0_10_35_52]|uniref:Type 4 fimbrial biogenesis protein PilX N-terminal domain-containing protein n=1 Tax=Candidatus Campbellbacteria bacterium CG10_big_fil_rev_8_21_14_0_10_35_52 TaxID=1974527 RepID=A0A2M6WVP9_9BACT|nr:MAG: hypothetical protein COT82_00915 [Candidatus Campbellbacteria bacterium CG10_big_fil_rev_8_21_14_0_10_35_52]
MRNNSKKQNKMQKFKNVFYLRASRGGFALLYAVLVSSILLAVGLAIFNITLKGLILSSLGRDSQFAFYAADTGVECALYWDIKNNAFATSTTSDIECVGNIINDIGGVGYGNPNIFTLNFSPEAYCAIVSVTKYQLPAVLTIVESRGYNICDTGNLKRVERGIKVTY